MKPNILWICTDQQRFDALGCYGNEYVKTPNIDKLAQSGVLFENAFCQSTICSPSRASFLTGRYPRTTKCIKNGQNIPKDEMLISRLLNDFGYTCGLSGKLHLSACHPNVNQGTERRINDGYDLFHWSHHPQASWPVNEYIHWLRAKGKEFQTRPVDDCEYVVHGPDAEDHQATWCAEKAIEFIDAHENKEQPWLFSVNMFAPHHPFDPPESHLQRYLDQLDEIPLPNYKEGELDNKPVVQKRDHQGAYANPNLYPFNRMTEKDHKYIRAAYWAMCDLIDEQVGRMVKALEKTNQLDNTIIIFMSDHGELLGDHGMYLKGPHFYEESIHVPLIISYPGTFKSNVRETDMVELLDLAPTLLEAIGSEPHPGMQGKSLYPLLTETETETETNHREDVFCEVDEARGEAGMGGISTMIRTETHKLVLHPNNHKGELYDLVVDPQEQTNLWGDVEYEKVQSQMLERMSTRLAGMTDPLPPKVAPW